MLTIKRLILTHPSPVYCITCVVRVTATRRAPCTTMYHTGTLSYQCLQDVFKVALYQGTFFDVHGVIEEIVGQVDVGGDDLCRRVQHLRVYTDMLTMGCWDSHSAVTPPHITSNKQITIMRWDVQFADVYADVCCSTSMVVNIRRCFSTKLSVNGDVLQDLNHLCAVRHDGSAAADETAKTHGKEPHKFASPHDTELRLVPENTHNDPTTIPQRYFAKGTGARYVHKRAHCMVTFRPKTDS